MATSESSAGLVRRLWCHYTEPVTQRESSPQASVRWARAASPAAHSAVSLGSHMKATLSYFFGSGIKYRVSTTGPCCWALCANLPDSIIALVQGTTATIPLATMSHHTCENTLCQVGAIVSDHRAHGLLDGPRYKEAVLTSLGQHQVVHKTQDGAARCQLVGTQVCVIAGA